MDKNQIIRCFDRAAKTYQAAMDIQSIAAQRLSTYLNRPASHILEIGCGTGAFSQYLVNRFHKLPILLTDISAEMVKITKQRFSDLPNVKIVCQDGEKLSLNSMCDLIVSNMVLHWFDDMFFGINQIMQQMTAGGSFIFAILGDNSLKEWQAACNKQNYSSQLLDFISLNKIQNYFPEVQFSAEKYVINYTSAHAFLRTLRNIGGTASSNAKSRLRISELRNLLHQYDDTFPVTYEIIYGSYVKP